MNQNMGRSGGGQGFEPGPYRGLSRIAAHAGRKQFRQVRGSRLIVGPVIRVNHGQHGIDAGMPGKGCQGPAQDRFTVE